MSTKINGKDVPKTTKLMISVEVCTVANCYTCTSGDMARWQICDSGYVIADSDCEVDEVAEEVESAMTMSQTATGVAMAAGMAVSALTMSSPQWMWFMVNQLQLMMLLPLTGAFMPKSILDYLSGMTFVNFNFDFIPVHWIPMVNPLFEEYGYEHNNSYLKEVGVESGNTFINNFQLLLTFTMLISLHLMWSIFYKCTEKVDENKWSRKLAVKLMELFMLAIYLRTLVQSHQVLLLSSSREIYELNLTSFKFIISFVFAMFTFLVSNLLVLLMCRQWFKARDMGNFTRQKYFLEFFNGIKENPAWRIYLFLNYGRRTFLILSVIVMKEADIYAILGVFCPIQLMYACWVCYLRPFEDAKDNVIDIMNEVFFIGFSSSLFYFNTESKWSNFASSAYMWAITANTLLITAVILIALGVQLIKKGCKSFKKDNKGKN